MMNPIWKSLVLSVFVAQFVGCSSKSEVIPAAKTAPPIDHARIQKEFDRMREEAKARGETLVLPTPEEAMPSAPK